VADGGLEVVLRHGFVPEVHLLVGAVQREQPAQLRQRLRIVVHP
jgi:hypothetical protein